MVLPPGEFNFNVMSSQSHVPHRRVKEFHAPCPWKIVLRHILFFCISYAVWASASGDFRIVFDTLVIDALIVLCAQLTRDLFAIAKFL